MQVSVSMPYMLIGGGLLILFPGAAILAAVLQFRLGHGALGKDLVRIGLVSFVLVLLANVFHWILLIALSSRLPPISAANPSWSVSLLELWADVGPCVWSILAVLVGATLVLGLNKTRSGISDLRACFFREGRRTQ